MNLKTNCKVSIKPFISGLENSGLEKLGMVVGDGARHNEDLGYVERNNIKCYLTGLNELAPEIQNIKDKEEKEAKIRDIRKTVVFLENSLGGNYEITEEDIDEYDAEKKPTGKLSNTFWNKVKMFISQGPDKFDDRNIRIPTYWDKVSIDCNNNSRELNPKNPHDLIIIYAIRAGGFTMIAPSMDAAKNAIEVPKFYLDNEEETASINTEVKKLRNEAGGELSKIFRKDINKLFYITKSIAINSLSYRKSTSPDILYDDCDKYINGETVEKNKKFTAEKFLELCDQELRLLRIQAIVKDSTELHLLTYKQDGNLYYVKTGTPMGKGIQDVIKFLENPLNEDVKKKLEEEVESEWIK